MNDIIDLMLYFGGFMFIFFSGSIIGRMKRFKDRPDHVKKAYAVALILVVLGPIALIYQLWKSGRIF